MPRPSLLTYGCPICFVNFEWNKAIDEPTFCPSCGASLSTRKASLTTMLDDPQDDRLTNYPIAAASSKGSFAIGGFSRG